MIIVKLRIEKTGKEIETTQRRINNWLGRNSNISRSGDQYVSTNGKTLYTIISRESKPRQQHNWLYELRFWIHGTFEGDDIETRVKFKYLPKKEEIKEIIKKAYRKYCMEPEEIFKTMGDDWKLWDLSNSTSVEPK